MFCYVYVCLVNRTTSIHFYVLIPPVPWCVAKTLHSCAGLRDGRYTKTQLLELFRSDITFEAAASRISEAGVLVIDEISMISAKIWTQLEYICRHVRHNFSLFGSLQIVAAGDFWQLKPVSNRRRILFPIRSMETCYDTCCHAGQSHVARWGDFYQGYSRVVHRWNISWHWRIFWNIALSLATK